MTTLDKNGDFIEDRIMHAASQKEDLIAYQIVQNDQG